MTWRAARFATPLSRYLTLLTGRCFRFAKWFFSAASLGFRLLGALRGPRGGPWGWRRRLLCRRRAPRGVVGGLAPRVDEDHNTARRREECVDDADVDEDVVVVRALAAGGRREHP